MIDFEHLMEMKDKMEECGQDGSTFICHPDVYESMIEAAKREYPDTSMELNAILGLKVLVLSSAPKDTIYLLSKDVVNRLMKDVRGRP